MCLNCVLPFLTAIGLGVLGALGGLGILFRRVFRVGFPIQIRPALAMDGRADERKRGFEENGASDRGGDEGGCGCSGGGLRRG
jgi:hypothetical protein